MMITRYTTDFERYRRMTTPELREWFMLTGLFREDELFMYYCEVERAVVGSAVPLDDTLVLEAGKEIAAEYFCERREVGVLNLGEAGVINVDGTEYRLENLECLYIGKGSRDITFASEDASSPAKFYILSYPAHAEYPTTLAKKGDAETVELGSQAECNVRTLNKYIHPNGIKSSQLVMGYTSVASGSAWNTMPPHTHARRTEVYLYFGMEPDTLVFHLMGPPEETRHLVVRDLQAVVSPMWSVHAGAGTGPYSFCWGMGGENQEFGDMDHVELKNVC